MVKTLQRVTFVASWFALTSVVLGQQRNTQQPTPPKAPPQQATRPTPPPPPPPPPKPKGPTSSSVARTYASRVATSSRVNQTRTEAAGREVVTQVEELQDPEGRFRAYREVQTETVGLGSKAIQSKQTVYGTDINGRRILIETTQADQQVLSDGSTRTTENRWMPDLNGRLELKEQQVIEEKTVAPGTKQKSTSVFQQGLNQPMQESERLQETERQVSKDVVQNESTLSRRNNGQFRVVETMNQEVRKGPTETVEDQTIRRIDGNGVLNPAERNLTRRSTANGQEQVVKETYQARPQSPGRLDLTERTRTTTTNTSDGGHQTITEVERRNLASPNEPLRVYERIVETVRAVGPDRWETSRQVFGLDGNGRLVPTVADQGQSAGGK